MFSNGRYSRQTLLKQIGKSGQKKLSKAKVAIVGCGALGTNIANNLVRSGVGNLTVVDRDLVELNNLQRQSLFNEQDVGLPKASVAVDKLKKVNSDIEIQSIVDDVNNENVENIVQNMDVVVDGTDNLLTRFLINDVCVKKHIPWVYGAAIETHGMTMNIVPNETPCFRCLIQNPPKPGLLPTCDTVGVLNTIPAVIANIETTEVLKIILYDSQINKNLLIYDVWSHNFNSVKISRRDNCECCVKHDFKFLNKGNKEKIISLCGSNAVQITPVATGKISFEKLKEKLKNLGEVEKTEIILKFKTSNYEFNIFRNGRTIIYGAKDKKLAKSLYAKYIGV